MSALSIDYGTARASRVPAPGIEQERLAEVIQLPARWQPNAEPVARPVRLTARGKLMVKVVVTILAVMVSIGIGAGLGMALRAPVGDVAVVVVESGQSLWSVATAAAEPGQDVRDVVAQIVSLNSLSESTIIAGQELLVPRR